MQRKLFLTLASAFLVWQSYQLMKSLGNFQHESWEVILFVGWIIGLFVTGIFAFLGFAYPTERLMPPEYYNVRKPARLQRICKVLRVDTFRKLLLATLWRSKKQRQGFYDGSRAGVQNLIAQSKKAEFGHLLPFALIAVISAYLLVTGNVKLSLATMLINIIGNLYPVLLQRHHRMRVSRLQQRLQSRPSR